MGGNIYITKERITMKLDKKQKDELREHGYTPEVSNVSLYRTDFKKLHVWKEVCKALGLRGDAYAYRRVTIGVCGTKFKFDWER